MEGAILSIIEDIQHRSAHIHWPEGIVPDQADLFAHNDIVIAATTGRIWEHLIHATAWPDWYYNSSDVTVNAPGGLLGAGVTFDWTTFGSHVQSTVHEFEPRARIGHGEAALLARQHGKVFRPQPADHVRFAGLKAQYLRVGAGHEDEIQLVQVGQPVPFRVRFPIVRIALQYQPCPATYSFIRNGPRPAH